MYKYLNILVLLLAFSPAHATLFDVTWSNNKGSHWTGVVNTTNNTLVIDSWTTNDRIRQWWKLPETESIIFDAVDINGDTFEIADDWDGTIGTDWAFFSRQSMGEVPWLAGTYTGIYSDSHIGWGGFMYELRDGNIRYSVDYTEAYITHIAFNPGIVSLTLKANSYTCVRSGLFQCAPDPAPPTPLIATYVDGQWAYRTPSSVQVSVPEPSAIALMGLALLGFGATRRKLKKH